MIRVDEHVPHCWHVFPEQVDGGLAALAAECRGAQWPTDPAVPG